MYKSHSIGASLPPWVKIIVGVALVWTLFTAFRLSVAYPAGSPKDHDNIKRTITLNLHAHDSPKRQPRLVGELTPMALAKTYFENCPFVDKERGPLYLRAERGDWVYRQDKEHAMFMEMILCGVPFAFTRFGDGEYLLARNFAIDKKAQAGVVDRWSWGGGVSKVGVELKESLEYDYTQGIYFFGFPQAASGQAKMLEWLVNTTKAETRALSYAVLWQGGCWDRTQEFFTDIVTTGNIRQAVILIINQESKHRKNVLMEWATDVIWFPDDVVNWWETEQERVGGYLGNIAKAYRGALFLVAVGPISEVVIFEMFRANILNTYIDFGSTIEKWTKGYMTRDYFGNPPPLIRRHPKTHMVDWMNAESSDVIPNVSEIWKRGTFKNNYKYK